MSDFNRGSEWNKWDLHVHTPDSIVHDYKKEEADDVWEKYITELEKLPREIKVLGINDYWFLDGYKKVDEYKKSGRLANIDLILPVIELRLRDYVGNDKLNKINYHILFSNELTVQDIEEEFIKKIEIIQYEHRLLSKENLQNFGQKCKDDAPEGKKPPESNLEIGFNNFTVELSKINSILNKPLFKDKYLKIIGQTEWKDFRWDGSAADKKSLINDVDFVFSASPTIENATKARHIYDGNVESINGKPKGLRTDHNILEHVRQCLVALTTEETTFLERISYQTNSLAKYPIAKDVDSQKKFSGVIVGSLPSEEAMARSIIERCLKHEKLISIFKHGTKEA
ncbi:MAG: hypothetical protein P8Y16_03755 [Sulfurimonas sp.]